MHELQGGVGRVPHGPLFEFGAPSAFCTGRPTAVSKTCVNSRDSCASDIANIQVACLEQTWGLASAAAAGSTSIDPSIATGVLGRTIVPIPPTKAADEHRRNIDKHCKDAMPYLAREVSGATATGRPQLYVCASERSLGPDGASAGAAIPGCRGPDWDAIGVEHGGSPTGTTECAAGRAAGASGTQRADFLRWR